MATTAFPLNPSLTAIAIGFKPPESAFIADRVMPRVQTAKRFAYTRYTLADPYTIPNTRVGRKSKPTIVDFGGARVEAECVDWGLDDPVPNDEIAAFEAMERPPGAVGPLEISTALLTSLIMTDREARVAAAVSASANYLAGQSVTLSGTSQWSDFTNSNPLDAMLTALDVPLFRPNVVVMGQSVWTKVRQHPRLIQAANASAQTGGAITRQQLAELLEVREVLVGASFQNTARRGQAATMSRIWGKFCALLYVNEGMLDPHQPTWGFTAQFGDRIAGDWEDKDIGLRGGRVVRSGESLIEVVSSVESGYLFNAAVA